MNEGIGVFRRLTRAEREARLRRTGIAAYLPEDGGERANTRHTGGVRARDRASGNSRTAFAGAKDRPEGREPTAGVRADEVRRFPAPHSPLPYAEDGRTGMLRFVVRAHSLLPLEYRLLGAGAAMGAASGWRSLETAGREGTGVRAGAGPSEPEGMTVWRSGEAQAGGNMELLRWDGAEGAGDRAGSPPATNGGGASGGGEAMRPGVRERVLPAGQEPETLRHDSTREADREGGDPPGRMLRRALRTAVRALYALGLDSGEVELAAQGGGRFAVLAVRPAEPEATGRLPEPYASAEAALRRRLAGEPPGRPGLVMGMDPEFLVLRGDTGRVVPASRYLPLDGVAGCDAGPPGTRGAFPVAELRPAARATPRALLAQLRSAARLADRLIPDRTLLWRAGGMPLRGWALGGHLHFSGIALTAPLLRALDNYLALPMALLADERAAARYPRYGTLGDYRLQPHGGFEYRTLPSFLVSPAVAEGAVHLAHLIASRYEELRLRPLDGEEAHRAYYAGDKGPLRAAFPALAADLRRLPGYAAAAEAVEPLFRRIAEGRTWDESENVRALWRS